MQWTRLPGGTPTPEFVALVNRLLAPPRRTAAAPRTSLPALDSATTAPAPVSRTAPVKKPSVPLLAGIAVAGALIAVPAALIAKQPDLGTALLAYSLGLRHAVDADHIAAIDNVTRKLMQEGKRPLTIGFHFALGHSAVVALAAAAIAATTTAFHDQIEAFKAWLALNNAELARALCVVDCRLAERHPPLLAWFEACIHFSDVVLLNRREGVENRWLSGFLEHFRSQHLPCLFETVKAGRIRNPALILEPQARRLTQIFDEEQDWIFTNAEGDEIDEEDITDDEEEEVQATPAVDPYFERRNGGRRVKELPDIAKYLG